jgi:hypothetical protein
MKIFGKNDKKVIKYRRQRVVENVMNDMKKHTPPYKWREHELDKFKEE